jgi:hypothetical protein
MIFHISLFSKHASGARRAPQGVGGLAILFYFILVYFHITHHVLGGLPQGVDGLAILFYFDLFHFIFVHFYDTHQVLVGHP